MSTREPDFSQIRTALEGGVPDRPTLFEFYLNGPLYERLAGRTAPVGSLAAISDREVRLDAAAALGRFYVDAFRVGGYDYVNFAPAVAFPDFRYRHGSHEKEASHSLNDAPLITNREEFEAFRWPAASDLDIGILDALTRDLPDGMEAMVFTPGGVLENLIDLTGYDNLCFMLVDDRDLAIEVAGGVGESLLEIYRAIVEHPKLGAIIANDDWGFKTQTMLSPSDLVELVFPSHRETVRLAHNAGKPILLHSCGQLEAVMPGIIDDLKYDAKHSYEDVILPVEDVYERWHGQIAILGGIDLDFLCTATTDEITSRSKAMLERVGGRGGYALGSGNSIPDYVPDDAYFAMTRAALEA